MELTFNDSGDNMDAEMFREPHFLFLEERVENVNLDILPVDGDRMLKELADGNMVIARSKKDFLYIVESDDMYHMFSHSVGAPGGGQKQMPIDEKNTAIVSKIAELADALYVAEFDREMEIYSVMYTAEQGILDLFPNEDLDTDEMVDFSLPEEKKSENNDG